MTVSLPVHLTPGATSGGKKRSIEDLAPDLTGSRDLDFGGMAVLAEQYDEPVVIGVEAGLLPGTGVYVRERAHFLHQKS